MSYGEGFLKGETPELKDEKGLALLGGEEIWPRCRRGEAERITCS